MDEAARSSAGVSDATVDPTLGVRALVPRPGTATGVGSLPGEDPLAAQRLVFDLLPDLPHLVELPDRGPGADMVGRTAAFLTELPVDLQPSGWRFVQRPGHDLRRALDLLDRDVDALAAVASDYTGPLKIQAAGPWTIAATIELTRGDKALQDASAVADIAASLADGLAAHVAAVRRACPGADVVVQLDEPALPAVRLGHVPTVSGFSVLRTPEAHELQGILAGVLAALPHAGVHCCASAVPLALLREAGARWVGVDATLLTPRDDDGLGEAYEAGLAVVLGLAGDLTPATSLFRRLGLGTEVWLAQTAVSPPCGMATAQTYRRLTELARELAETVAP